MATSGKPGFPCSVVGIRLATFCSDVLLKSDVKLAAASSRFDMMHICEKLAGEGFLVAAPEFAGALSWYRTSRSERL